MSGVAIGVWFSLMPGRRGISLVLHLLPYSAPTGRAPQLESQQDIAQLHPVAVLQKTFLEHRHIVDPRMFRRSIVIAQNIEILTPTAKGVRVCSGDVPKQGNVRMLVAAEKVVGFFQRIFPAFLPPA